MKKHIVVLSGAGISAESGISTFRDADGLWENFPIEEVATPQAWQRNPTLVQRFYNMRRAQVIAAQPNKAHLFFVGLEQDYKVTIITQNIDDLHERAGSSSILHLHGNIRYAKSSGPNQECAYYRIEGDEIKEHATCPDGYPLRPHVVWFGEDVPELSRAANLVEHADILVVIGTSLAVYPAASLAFIAPAFCEKYVIDPKVDELNIDASFVKIPTGACEGVEILSAYLKA